MRQTLSEIMEFSQKGPKTITGGCLTASGRTYGIRETHTSFKLTGPKVKRVGTNPFYLIDILNMKNKKKSKVQE